jgi:hypothetical protein
VLINFLGAKGSCFWFSDQRGCIASHPKDWKESHWRLDVLE